ncbi:Acetyl-CoA:oxalate CoA-transferase [Methylobacterium crusticola]|uniref:Acetyl-CoA:oxalate CoA-transferase n=1 Tax=Methylobacterium crusticola TaxID=1697972 RepID=A0ABQ4R4S1_9HYPH|nr:CoA transferase [Methylobacterium crusticola]GJD52134.1 Acetyl-CoA:oxalate CoA-transferase [Methylobacterium crusticola]
MKLEGLKVVDLSVFLPGPYLTMVLADHGAEVIKVEPPGEGDPGRQIGPADGPSTVFFRNVNRGKRSVVLDLKTEAGRAALLALCDEADVFVETFRPGVAARLGFDDPTLRGRNPRLVYCSISAFGQTGPYAARPAHDLAAEALAGAVGLTLGRDDAPAIPGIPAADMLASLHALSGVLMALLRRHQTGRGDYIDAAMHESVLASMPNVLGPALAEGRQPVPKHERSMGGSAFYQIYGTADGRHVVLGGQEIKFVRTLLGRLDRLDLLPLCEAGPGPHQAPLVAFLRDVFRERSQAEWIAWFAPLDVCFAPVKTLPEALGDEHALARGMILTDEAGRRHVAPAIRFRDEPPEPRLREPALGEHTRAVLAERGGRAR